MSEDNKNPPAVPPAKMSAEPTSVELTEKEKLALVAEARAEVMKSLKKAEADRFKNAAKARIQQELMFQAGKNDKGEDLEEVKIDIAGYPKRIIIDGQVYENGRTYKKRRGVVQLLNEIMDRGWKQEAARFGERTEQTDSRRKVLSRQGLRYLPG